MERKHFETQLRRLASTYGANAYPEERARILWQHFQGVPDRVFERAVTALIGAEDRPPMLPTLERAVLEADEELSAADKPARAECEACGDAGHASTELAGGVWVATPCNCAAGDAYREAAIENARRARARERR